MDTDYYLQFKSRNVGEPAEIAILKPDEYQPTQTECGDVILISKVKRTKFVKPTWTERRYTFTAGERVKFSPEKSDTDPGTTHFERERTGVIVKAVKIASEFNKAYLMDAYEILGDNGVVYSISKYGITRLTDETQREQWSEYDYCG